MGKGCERKNPKLKKDFEYSFGSSDLKVLKLKNKNKNTCKNIREEEKDIKINKRLESIDIKSSFFKGNTLLIFNSIN